MTYRSLPSAEWLVLARFVLMGVELLLAGVAVAMFTLCCTSFGCTPRPSAACRAGTSTSSTRPRTTACTTPRTPAMWTATTAAR